MGVYPYEHDIIQVVKLGEHYQIKYLRYYRLGGFEECLYFGEGWSDRLTSPKLLNEKVNDHKLSNNISRAITKCREYALSNDWDYFATLTIDPKKMDRYDLESFWTEFSKFIKALNRKHKCHVDFLLVPERHENGAWHLHGLLHGLPDNLVSRNKFGYLDFPDYSNRFGFINLDPVRSTVAVSMYITKHLSKQIYNGVLRPGSHLYHHSRGLTSGVVVSLLRASNLPADFTFQYESEDKSYKSSFYEDSSFLEDLGII